MNIALFNKALAHIENNPLEWDQSTFVPECGTAMCLAGWCNHYAKKPVGSTNVWAGTGATQLGISLTQASWLFARERTLADFKKVRNTYDSNPYCMGGYDVEGYDAKGFDEYGYDVEGYNAKGFDTEGFDARGFDEEGFDEHGFGALTLRALGL